jgi:hypothetical protein
MAIFQDFYSHSRRLALKAVSDCLNNNAERMNNLKTEALKIANSCIISKNITDSMYEMYQDSEEERVLTEVEFAEMAL